MRIQYLIAGFTLLSAAFADTLTLRDGRTIQGTYLGGTARQVKMEVGDRIENYDVSQITSLTFAGGGSSASSGGASYAAAPRNNAVAAAGTELPAGTPITVRMIDSVDSEKNRIGETFRASLDEPVLVNGQTLIPRSADVTVKLVDDKKSGRLTGKTVMTLDLVSVSVNGRMVDINTTTVTQASGSRTARTAKVAGGTAAVGAIIGGIAGGGRGAAIGAGAGAGAGAGVQVLTGGQKVHIPSETRLTFTTETAVLI